MAAQKAMGQLYYSVEENIRTFLPAQFGFGHLVSSR